MVLVRHQEIEWPIRHALKVNEIHLAPHAETFRNNRLMPSSRLCTASLLNASWASVCEYFLKPTGYAFTEFAYDAIFKCSGLRMIVILCVNRVQILKDSVTVGDLNGILKCRPFVLHENEYILILESDTVIFLDPFVRLAVPFLCRKLFECCFVERFLFLASISEPNAMPRRFALA